mmetsp:Transcript_19/g.36  ORF Transcript_19/g.36 Transcript_19/m.36 type:complete len:293 (-) Transcript_19:89-967(-)
MSSNEPSKGNRATAKGEGKATKHTYGVLERGQVKDEAWLLRIPPKLAKVWQDAPEGTVLGDLIFTKGGPSKGSNGNGAKRNGSAVKPTFAITVPEELSENQPDLPLRYNFEAMTKKVPTLHPFTRRPDGSIKLHGTVTRSANLQMERTDERYRRLRQNRLIQSNVNSSRFVRPVETNELSVRKSHSAALTKSMTGFGNAVQQFGKSMIEASEGSMGDNSRKRKYEGQTTRSVIFELFSQQPLWTVKEMRSVSGRLEKEIREVLSEVAEFHRSGENKNKWELRKEFQAKMDSA